MIVAANFSRPEERAALPALRARFGDALRVIGTQPGDDWRVTDMDKTTVEWTRRMLRRAYEEPAGDILVKIDPDTIFHGTPGTPPACDIGGDFRRVRVGWIWFGAFQYFTRNAIERLLADAEYAGPCDFQDFALTRAAARLGLVAYNMPEVNGWARTIDPIVAAMHPGRGSVPRKPPGYVDLKK